MGKRVALALVAWLILGATHHTNPKAEEAQAQTQQSIADSLNHISITYHQETERSRSSEPKTEDCGPAKYRTSADLCAQWKAADAAADSAWWAWASGIAGIGSLVGVFVAICLTYQANQIARKMGQAQTRCYLTIDDASVQIETCEVKAIRCTLRNSGQSPAKNVHWIARFSIIHNNEILQESEYFKNPVSASVSDIGSGIIESMMPMPVNFSISGEVQELRNNWTEFSLICRIQCFAEDVFKSSEFVERSFISFWRFNDDGWLKMAPVGRLKEAAQNSHSRSA